MQKKFLIFALFIFYCLTTSCSAQKHYLITKLPENSYVTSRAYMLDDQFSDLEKKRIMLAFREWEFATNNIVSFYYVGDFPHYKIEEFDSHHSGNYDYRTLTKLYVSKYTEHDMNIYYAPQDEPERVLGGVLFSGMFLISDKLTTDTMFKGVAMHEVGHFLGLDHVNQKEMIMHKTCSEQNCASDNPLITTEDIRLFCSVSNLCKLTAY